MAANPTPAEISDMLRIAARQFRMDTPIGDALQGREALARKFDAMAARLTSLSVDEGGEMDRLRAENDRMRRALELYASSIHWMTHTDSYDDPLRKVWVMSTDGPYEARKALGVLPISSADIAARVSELDALGGDRRAQERMIPGGPIL